MSFSGDLEHLPVVDVIQLLHSTQKTGTLHLSSHKGESQLVFSGGYIVSANHVRNSVRIGHILVNMEKITQEQLEHALNLQSIAGNNRKPLIATLIESGQINREDAYSGLEILIEMTIVEILTWNSGTFTLDVNSTVVCDEYRYFPETLKQELSLNTQGLLMDALRIYDEKKRDGTLNNGPFASHEASVKKPSGEMITADDLGLGDLDSLDKKIPDVFLGLKDYDLSEIHRQKLRETMKGLPIGEHDRLLTILMEYSKEPVLENNSPRTSLQQLAVILFSNDEFISHCITTVCKHEHIYTFVTDDAASLSLIVEQSFSKELIPVLVVDSPSKLADSFSEQKVVDLLMQIFDKYPHIPVVQLVTRNENDFSLQALQTGVQNVLSRPRGEAGESNIADDYTRFLRSFQEILQKSSTNPEQQIFSQFKDCITQLGNQRKVPDIAFQVLKFAATMFERSITFVVGDDHLIAEKGFGINSHKNTGATPPLLFTLPLSNQSLVQDVVSKGQYFYGQCNDAVIRDNLHSHIGAPNSPKIMLMPIKTYGKAIALIYGDFGNKSGAPLKIDLLEIVAQHASLVLENNIYRSKLASISSRK